MALYGTMQLVEDCIGVSPAVVGVSVRSCTPWTSRRDAEWSDRDSRAPHFDRIALA